MSWTEQVQADAQQWHEAHEQSADNGCWCCCQSCFDDNPYWEKAVGTLNGET